MKEMGTKHYEKTMKQNPYFYKYQSLLQWEIIYVTSSPTDSETALTLQAYHAQHKHDYSKWTSVSSNSRNLADLNKPYALKMS